MFTDGCHAKTKVRVFEVVTFLFFSGHFLLTFLHFFLSRAFMWVKRFCREKGICWTGWSRYFLCYSYLRSWNLFKSRQWSVVCLPSREVEWRSISARALELEKNLAFSVVTEVRVTKHFLSLSPLFIAPLSKVCVFKCYRERSSFCHSFFQGWEMFRSRSKDSIDDSFVILLRNKIR